MRVLFRVPIPLGLLGCRLGTVLGGDKREAEVSQLLDALDKDGVTFPLWLQVMALFSWCNLADSPSTEENQSLWGPMLLHVLFLGTVTPHDHGVGKAERGVCLRPTMIWGD